MDGVKLEIELSNRLESLFDRLFSRLYSSNTDPFARRLIVVPTASMKSWIQQRLAELQGIATGLDFVFLEPGIAQMAGAKGWLPSTNELALRIEQLLGDDPSEQVTKFIGSGRQAKSRRTQLAHELAGLFQQYGLYGSKVKLTGWQGEIWEAIDWPNWAQILGDPKYSGQIHLFGFSFIPPLFYRFLSQIPATFYTLSPCLAFWSDIRSDSEIGRMVDRLRRESAPENQLEELTLFLREHNRLLANFGRLGREMVAMIEESGAITHESYVATQSVGDPTVSLDLSGEVSNLRTIQEEMLNLTPGAKPVPDGSVEIHIAPSKWREVEVVHQLVWKHVMEGVAPSDIVVLAPAIGEYAPYIRAVFGGSDGTLPFIITDLAELEPGSASEGFLQLIGLGKSRWEVSALVDLLEHPSMGLKPDEIEMVREWVADTHIHWGQDRKHQAERLTEEYSGQAPLSTTNSTWGTGMDRLIQALSIGEIPLSRADLAEKLVAFCLDLSEDLRAMAEEMSLTAWVDYFEALASHYLSVAVDDSLLDRLRRMRTTVARLPDTPLSFEAVYQYLADELAQAGAIARSNNLEGIQFSSMVPMRAIPAKVVCLVGLQEGVFPRPVDRQPLNQLQGHPQADRCPSRGDFDRYLFLEAILSARRAFYAVCGDEPSPLLTDLLNYLGHEPIDHPHFAFHHSYFLDQGPGSLVNFERALAACADKQARATVELPALEVVDELTIDLRDLRSTISDPFRAFLQARLGFYLDDHVPLTDHDPITLDPLDLYQLAWRAIDTSLDEALSYGVDRGMVPAPPFESIAMKRVASRVEEITKALHAHGVDPRTLKQLCLSDGYLEEVEIDDRTRGRPPLVIDHKGRQIKIVGDLQRITDQGVVVAGVADLPSWAVANRCQPNLGLIPLKKVGKIDLHHLFDYHFMVRDRLSPILPQWIDLIIKGDAQRLGVAMERESYSPYARWCFRAKLVPPPEAIIEEWQGPLTKTFGAET